MFVYYDNYNMINFLKKKTLFMFGVLFTGVMSILSFFINNSSKDDSLFVPIVSADISAWSGTDAGGGSGGSSCGGCSGAGGDSAGGGGDGGGGGGGGGG